jgi:hypothetical protein
VVLLGPRYGRLGLHLDPSGPAPARPHCLSRVEEEGWLGRGAAMPTACLLQCDDVSFTGISRPRRAYGRAGLVSPTVGSGRLLPLTVEVGPSRMRVVLLPLVLALLLLLLLQCASPTSLCRGETSWVASRSWWRRVVCIMVECSGAPGVMVGIGRNPCRPVRHRHGGALGCRRAFLNGVRCYPSFLLAAYGGKPLAAASSSSRPLLEVLFGTIASESRSFQNRTQVYDF